ncbi:MAG: hypothetical protein LUC40_00255 [Oscillospiraceae bacterium]|nr:hypothetical protein [Oscillospiraceae bacterium]
MVSEYSKSVVGGIAGYSFGTLDSCMTEESAAVSGYQYSAGIVGYVGYSSGNDITDVAVTNCVNYADVSKVGGDSTYSDGAAQPAVGGIIGYAYRGTYSSLIEISSCANLGGLTGSADSSYGVYCGGIVGHVGNATQVTSCYNAGDIEMTGIGRAGGIVGYCGLAQGTSYLISQCYSSGDITGTPTAANTGYSYVGGLLGYNYVSSSAAAVQYSYACGDLDVPEASYVGGIVGANVGYYTSCFWFGDTLSGQQWGAVIAMESPTAPATIKGCFYGFTGEGDGSNGEEYTPTNADGITEAAAADFSGGYVAYVLETADGEHKGIWTMYTGDVADTDEDADADESESGTGSSGMESIETVLERLTEQTDAHPVLGEGSIYRIEVDEFSVRGGGGSDDADSQDFLYVRPLDTPGQYSGKWYAGTTTTYVYVSAGSSNVGGFFCNDLLAELWSQAEDDSQYITLVWSVFVK